MRLHPKLYRTRLVLVVLRIFVFPLVVLSQILKLCGVRLGFLSIPAHFGAIIFWGYLRNTYYDITQTRLANRLGA